MIYFSQVKNEQRGGSGGKLIVLSLHGSNETNAESGGQSKWRSEGQRRKSFGIWEESVRPGMGEFWKRGECWQEEIVIQAKCWLHVVVTLDFHRIKRI